MDQGPAGSETKLEAASRTASVNWVHGFLTTMISLSGNSRRACRTASRKEAFFAVNLKSL
jgi:hypothetical protein